MPNNIWSLVSGRNECSSSVYLSIMHWMSLAVILLVSNCLADENASYKKAKIMEQAEENIRWLRQAKEQVEREEREKNSLAALADTMIKDSFDSQLMSKMDILYDNQTDLNKELKFVPQVFNCGKEFDIFKVLELAKAHRNITTEQPPCIVDEDDNLCTTKKANGGANNTNKMMRNTALPQTKEAAHGVNAFAIQGAISTRVPAPQPRTAAALRQPLPNPQPKTANLKPQPKQKPLPVVKEVGDKVPPNRVQKQLETKGIISKPVVAYRRFRAEPSVDDIQLAENPQIAEDQLQSLYAAQAEKNEPLQYPSNENQNKNDDQIKLQEPQVNKPEEPPESLQANSAKLPISQTFSKQTQPVEQPLPSQVVEQSQMQNLVMGDMAQHKQPGLEKITSEVSEQGDQAGNSGPISIVHENVLVVTQTQQQPQQGNIIQQAPLQQSLTQSQFSEQQKYLKQQQPQILEKQIQKQDKQLEQEPQPLEKQKQEQLSTAEQHNEQQFQPLGKQNQNLENQNQQQLQSAERLNQVQHQTYELQKQQQVITAEQQKPQQVLTAEQQNQQQVPTAELQQQQQLQTDELQKQIKIAEQQKQQQLQTAEQQKQQIQTMEKHYSQFQTSEKYNQPQLQTIEKQPQAIKPTVTDFEHQKPPMAAVSVSEQQQVDQKTYSTSDQQQTLFPLRIEQNQQAAKPNLIPNKGTSEQQGAQLPDTKSVGKLPSDVNNKGLSESTGEKLFNSSDKTMISAPINVMVMDPNLNSSNENSSYKVNLVPGNIPATAYFWGYTLAHTPKIQNNNMKTEQNKAASVANNLEGSEIPGNNEENPKWDYLYYQDQD